MEANFALSHMSRASFNLEFKTRSRFHLRSSKRRSATLPSTTPDNMEDEDEQTAIKQAKSATKAGRVLGLSQEATLSRQEQLSERNYLRFTQQIELAKSQSHSSRGKFNIRTSLTKTRQNRANSSPSAFPSRNFQLGTANNIGVQTRRSTLPNTTNITAESSPNTSTSPQGTEARLRRRSSVPRRVLEKALSVKRRLTVSSKRSLEVEIPVFEDDEEDFNPDLAIDTRGFELEFPPHISQDKSELDYIRRKNTDAMLQIDTDIQGPDVVDDEDVDWAALMQVTPVLSPSCSNSNSNSDSTPSDASTSPSSVEPTKPLTPLTPLTPSKTPLAITNSHQTTNPTVRNTEAWKEIQWHMDAVVSHSDNIAGDQSPESCPADASSIHGGQFSLPERGLSQEGNQEVTMEDVLRKFKKPRRVLMV